MALTCGCASSDYVPSLGRRAASLEGSKIIPDLVDRVSAASGAELEVAFHGKKIQACLAAPLQHALAHVHICVQHVRGAACARLLCPGARNHACLPSQNGQLLAPKDAADTPKVTIRGGAEAGLYTLIGSDPDPPGGLGRGGPAARTWSGQVPSPGWGSG